MGMTPPSARSGRTWPSGGLEVGSASHAEPGQVITGGTDRKHGTTSHRCRRRSRPDEPKRAGVDEISRLHRPVGRSGDDQAAIMAPSAGTTFFPALINRREAMVARAKNEAATMNATP